MSAHLHRKMTGAFEEAVFAIGEIAADLFHPRSIGTRRDACNVRTAGFQMPHGENVERDQSVSRPDFNSRDVRGKDRIPVRFQERGPRWCSLPIRCWFNAVCLQYVGDCRISDVVADVLKCSLNSVVAPRRIFSGEANDVADDFLSNSWATRFTLGARIELLGDEFAVPAKYRVWRNNGGQFQQSLASNGVSLHSEQSTLVVIEQQSLLSELLQQSLDLSVLEFDDLLLTLIDHATECSEQHVPWREQEGHVWPRESPVSDADR